MLQVKAHIGGQGGRRQFGQQLLRNIQWQLGIDRVVFALRLQRLEADARHLGQEHQFVGLELDGNAGGNFFHAEVERLARGRKAKGRHQHHGTHVERAMDAADIDLAHQARMHEIHAVHNADGACGNKIARYDAHRGPGHGRIGQALAESSLDLESQLASGFLGAVQRNGIGHPYAV
ncbi:hypothetical protein D3C72_1230240 [compost metagenome]